MMDETNQDEAKDLWRHQPLEDTAMSLDQVRAGIATLNSKVRRRNLVGGLASLIVLLFSVFCAIAFSNPIQRIGSVLTVLGAGYLLYQLILGKIHIRPETASGNTADGLTFYRSELQRQRDFHKGVRFWSRLVIYAPGPVIFFIGFWEAYPWLFRIIVVELAVFVLLLIAAIPLNLRAARKYQRELDALESYKA
jgi:hypothetical protein